MREFLLLMRGERSPHASPEQMQQRMKDYMGWMKKMTDEGRLRTGQPLEPRGRWLKDKKTVVTDGPFLEPNEVIGGYVIIEAEDLDDAAEIARDCPLLEHCEIFVRPLVDVPS